MADARWWVRMLLILAVPAALCPGATLGHVDTFASPGTVGWATGSFPGLSNPGTGGADGAGDGFLRIATGTSSNFGARSTHAGFQGDWTAAGITELSLWLNDVGDPQAFEIHVIVSDGAFSTSWQYNESFVPPHQCWQQFHVDLTDESKWTQIRGHLTLAQVLTRVDRVTLRHDRAPYLDFPDGIAGDVGVDNIMLGPVAASCPALFADADSDGDVDQDDFGAFQICFSGECAVRPAVCACFDRNRDGHVGADDLESFTVCISGPAVPADPACGD